MLVDGEAQTMQITREWTIECRQRWRRRSVLRASSMSARLFLFLVQLQIFQLVLSKCSSTCVVPLSLQDKHQQTDGVLSQGRGFMGAAMVTDPEDVLLFAGGITGGLVEDNLDALGSIQLEGSLEYKLTVSFRNSSSAGDGKIEVRRDVSTMQVPRTDTATGATTRTAIFAGGCGAGLSPPQDREEGVDYSSGTDSSAYAATSAASVPDVPLLVKNCRATDVVDAFVVTGTRGVQGEATRASPEAVVAPNGDSLRLCERKYAATVGVFYTGANDDDSPYTWAPTAHFMVAGGIISTGGGRQYTATDSVDVFREDEVDADTGKVAIGTGSVGFNSDRADVWDGSTWSFVTWGEHTLSEARHFMGTAAVELTLDQEKRTVGLLAGGISDFGPSATVDMFDFNERRMLPRMHAPTIRGPTQGISLSREEAAFIGDTGKLDVFDGRQLCWTSYEVGDLLPGTSVVGRPTPWFFDASSAGFDAKGGDATRDASLFLAGGVGGEDGRDVSRKVLALYRRHTEDHCTIDKEACAGGKHLRQVLKVCGVPGPDGSIVSFTPSADSQDADDADAYTTETAKRTSLARMCLYAVAALAGILISYAASAAIIVRKMDGAWHLPFGGSLSGSLRGIPHRILSCCCWSNSCDDKRDSPDEEGPSNSGTQTGASEGRRLLHTGDIETVRAYGAKDDTSPPPRYPDEPKDVPAEVRSRNSRHPRHQAGGTRATDMDETVLPEPKAAAAVPRHSRVSRSKRQRSSRRRANAVRIPVLPPAADAAHAAQRLAAEVAAEASSETE